MDDYDLRSCFLPDLSGLHLRIYQFQRLLYQHLPELATHLEKLDLSSAYLTPWFLSFFATACPLPLLFRIYDVIFAEGASETLMRVALAIMQRNQRKLMSFTEMEDAMQLLLSRQLWDPYGLSATSADELVSDFVSFTGVVSRESLQALETSFKEAQAQNADAGGSLSFFPAVQQTASRFLQRKLFTYSSPTKDKAASSSTSAVAAYNSQSQSLTAPGLGAPSRPTSLLMRTPSKQSLSTLYSNGDSTEGSLSIASTSITEVSDLSRDSAGDYMSMKSIKSPTESIGHTMRGMMSSKDKDLHVQIEDLLLALTELQREHASIAVQLQREREERGEDRTIVKSLLDQLRQDRLVRPVTPSHRRNTLSMSDLLSPLTTPKTQPLPPQVQKLVEDVDIRMTPTKHHRKSSGYETKTQLKVKLSNYKDQLQNETTRTQELNRQLADKEHELSLSRDELSQSRLRIQREHAERERLQKVISDLRQQIQRQPSRGRSNSRSSHYDNNTSDQPTTAGGRPTTADSTISTKGLREFRLGRTPSGLTAQPPRRTSSLAVTNSFDQSPSLSSTGASPAHSPHLSHQSQTQPPSPMAADEQLLQDLVTAKTAEAIARQELDEMQQKFEQMKRMLAAATLAAASNAGTSGISITPVRTRTGSISSRTSATVASSGDVSGGVEWPSCMVSTHGGVTSVPGTPQASAGASPTVLTSANATPPASASTSSGGWGVGGGGFFGWGKRSTSSALPTTAIGATGSG